MSSSKMNRKTQDTESEAGMMEPEVCQTESVCRELSKDHRLTEERLNLLACELHALSSQAALPKDRSQVIRKITAQLTEELNTHFACEEYGLFPVLSKHHPMVLMEVEHEELLALRMRFCEALEAEGEDLVDAGMTLIEELRDHIAREDAGIFPMAERELSLEEKRRALEAMTRIREEAKASPTPELRQMVRGYQVLDALAATPGDRPRYIRTLAEVGNLQIKQLVLQAGESIASHWTPHRLILVCLAGEGHFTVQEKTEPFVVGRVVVLDPRLNHALSAITTCTFLAMFQNVEG